MKTKATTRIIAIVLVAVTILGLVAGSIAGMQSGTSSIKKLLKDKNILTAEQIAAVVEKNKENDYTLESLLSVFGNPGAITIDFNGTAPATYTQDSDIEAILVEYKDHQDYNQDSIIQLMWMDELENLVFTIIATEFNVPTIIGVIQQSFEDITSSSKLIPTTEAHLSDFTEYTAETLKTVGEGYLISTQHPLLECNYTKENVLTADFESVWTTKTVKNDLGVIYILLKNGEPYQLYQEYDSDDLAVYDKSEKLKTGLNERQFLNIYPDALKIQLYNHVENDLEYYIVSYAVKEKLEDGTIQETIYNIVDEDLYIYDEDGNLIEPEGGLIIEQATGSTGTGTTNTESEETTPEPTDTVEEDISENTEEVVSESEETVPESTENE